jgi:hypothetical protein
VTIQVVDTETFYAVGGECTSARILEMTTHPSELPEISSYLDIIGRFIGRDISAEISKCLSCGAVKSEHRILGDPVFPVLEELFEDADAYVDRAELRTEPEDLDAEQLLACAHRARDALRGLGYE